MISFSLLPHLRRGRYLREVQCPNQKQILGEHWKCFAMNLIYYALNDV